MREGGPEVWDSWATRAVRGLQSQEWTKEVKVEVSLVPNPGPRPIDPVSAGFPGSQCSVPPSSAPVKFLLEAPGAQEAETNTGRTWHRWWEDTRPGKPSSNKDNQ